MLLGLSKQALRTAVGAAAALGTLFTLALASPGGAEPGVTGTLELRADVQPRSTRAPEQSVAGTLELNASLALTSRIGACPAPPSADDCAARTISGLFPGLGSVTGTYDLLVKTAPPPCDAVLGKALSYPIRLAVASKGEITVAVAEGPCVDHESIRTQTQSFTVTAETGIYAGVSGSGSLARVLGGDTGNGRSGQERWTGTIVPGLEFDTTRPTLSGATRKTVKAKKGAKSARVVFKVSAQDDKDGSVPVACSPQSGSRFSTGRTRVSCSANDSSGNATTASFVVTVRKAR